MIYIHPWFTHLIQVVHILDVSHGYSVLQTQRSLLAAADGDEAEEGGVGVDVGHGVEGGQASQGSQEDEGSHRGLTPVWVSVVAVQWRGDSY